MNILDYLHVGELDKKEPVKVVLYEDESCDMAEVHINGINVYSGNYGDFYNGCYALERECNFPDFNDHHEYVEVLCDLLKEEGFEVEYSEEEYEYDD